MAAQMRRRDRASGTNTLMASLDSAVSESGGGDDVQHDVDGHSAGAPAESTAFDDDDEVNNHGAEQKTAVPPELRRGYFLSSENTPPENTSGSGAKQETVEKQRAIVHRELDGHKVLLAVDLEEFTESLYDDGPSKREIEEYLAGCPHYDNASKTWIPEHKVKVKKDNGASNDSETRMVKTALANVTKEEQMYKPYEAIINHILQSFPEFVVHGRYAFDTSNKYLRHQESDPSDKLHSKPDITIIGNSPFLRVCDVPDLEIVLPNYDRALWLADGKLEDYLLLSELIQQLGVYSRYDFAFVLPGDIH